MAGDININMALNRADEVIKSARFVTDAVGHRSLTQMASDSILQFPVIMSSAIDLDVATTIAKALERQYASLFLSIISLNGHIDLQKFDNVTDYIKSFHNNRDNPELFKTVSGVSKAVRALNNTKVYDSYLPDTPAGRQIVLDCWNVIDDSVTLESLNNLYKPFEKYVMAVENALAMRNKEPIMEAKGKTPQDFAKTTSNLKNINRAASQVSSIKEERSLGIGSNKSSTASFGTDSPKMMEARQATLSMLEPTLINVQFLLTGKDSSGNSAGVPVPSGKGGTSKGNQMVTNAWIGIKSMIRMISSDIMVSNMVQATVESDSIFKYLKWTQGEIKFIRDIIFKVTDIKNEALSKRTSSKYWVNAKKRKASGKIDKGILPTTTIVMSSYEVARVKEITGIDLYDVKNAIKVMQKYYFLGLVIYDPDTGIVSTLFDSFNDFADMTITGLKNSNARTDDALDTKSVLKLIGKAMN